MFAVRRRRGIATLEMVLVFPLLLALVAGIMLIGRADKAKMLTATKARNDAWKKRPQAAPGDPLLLGNDPIRSEIDGSSTLRVAPGALFRDTEFKARTNAAATAHPWDRRVVPFNTGRSALDVHRDELSLVVRNVPHIAGVVDTGLATFAWTMNPDRNIGLMLVAVAGRIANVAVIIAGYEMLAVSYAFQGAKFALDIAITALEIAESGWSWLTGDSPWLRFLKATRQSFVISIDVFHNLYDASQGRPGHWNPDAYWWLLRFFAWGV